MSAALPAGTRLIRLAGGVVLVAALAACGPGTDVASSPGATSPTPSSAAAPPSTAGATPSPVPSSGPGVPSGSATAGASGIPASALLQPSDVSGPEPEPVPEGEFAHLRPLRPCGDDDPYPSDGSRTAAVAVKYLLGPVGAGATPSVVTEFVGRHAPGGAARQFDEVAAALKRCPGGLAKGQRRWTVLDTGPAGDESALVRIDGRYSYADEPPDTVSHYAALARVDDVIVVVTDLGWENAGGSEKLVRDLIRKATRRAATLT